MTNTTIIWPVNAISIFLPTVDVGNMTGSFRNDVIILEQLKQYKGKSAGKFIDSVF
jgi:hypothetical protein